MPDSNGSQPATRADVRALEEKMERRLQELDEKIDRRFVEYDEKMDQRFAQYDEKMDQRFAKYDEKMDRRFAEAMERTQEFVRDIQTELLRGFQAYAGSFDTRFSKLQADVSILDTATERRLVILERRMLEIEKRLPPVPPSTI